MSLWLVDRLREFGEDPAVVWRGSVCSYRALADEVGKQEAALDVHGLGRGEVVALEADYSPRAVALLLALIGHGSFCVPLTVASAPQRDEFMEIAEVGVSIALRDDESYALERTGRSARHPFWEELCRRGAPGLVLFSSGSTGKSKAAVHDFAHLLDKFRARKQKLRAITFLLLDHIGGINTLFYTLSNGGTVVTVPDHAPETVCEAIAKHRVELLPTSPTFLNLLLLSGALERHDLSSLRLVTYGTEPMPESTLRRVAEALPHVTLQQTYGLSELGILRSKSKDNRSLWVKIGGEGFETEVRDGILWIKAHSAMLGYLNAPSPFDDRGWMNTGDEVEQDGEWFLIRGRRSEIINVGGQKVYPAEVESVVQTCDNVADVTVHGEAHPVTGQIVACRVNLATAEEPREFRKRLRTFCRERLAPYKVPVKIDVTDTKQWNARHKRLRKP